MNNLDVLHSGRIASVNDAKTLADLLAVDYRAVMALPDLHWIERRQGSAEPVRGVLSFGRTSEKKPSNEKPEKKLPKERSLRKPVL
jgi:ribosomal protein L15E